MTPLDFVREDAGRLVEEWGRIALIPAPAGAEAARAELIASLAPADRVGLDRVGNVVAEVDGDDPAGETLTYLATMDDLGSVAAHRAAHPDLLHRDGDRLIGPCTETSSSCASALSILRFLSTGPRPWKKVVVAFVLGEETGLTGARALVADRGAELGSVVDLMGGIGTVSWNAVGFAGLGVEFRTTPRHSLYGGVSEVADAIARFTALVHADVPASSPDPLRVPEPVAIRRINRIHAGEVFNWSPESGAVGVDIRAVDPDLLARLYADTRALAAEAAAAAGVEAVLTDGEHRPAFQLPGGAAHRLVRALAEAISYAGGEPVLRPWSSSNVNVAYAAGLAGVVHDGTVRGGGRGTAEEWADIPGVLAGVAADCRLLELLTAPGVRR